MTIAQYAPEWPIESIRTQPVFDEDVMPFPPQNATDHNPNPQLLINADELTKTIDRLSGQKNEQYRNWPTALRLLTAWLDGLTFSEVSTVVGIEAKNLRKILHGKLPLNRSKQSRVGRVLEVTRLLRSVIAEEDIGRWYQTGDPALKGLSPIEALKMQKIAEVERVVGSYFDSSYA